MEGDQTASAWQTPRMAGPLLPNDSPLVERQIPSDKTITPRNYLARATPIVPTSDRMATPRSARKTSGDPSPGSTLKRSPASQSASRSTSTRSPPKYKEKAPSPIDVEAAESLRKTEVPALPVITETSTQPSPHHQHGSEGSDSASSMHLRRGNSTPTPNPKKQEQTPADPRRVRLLTPKVPLSDGAMRRAGGRGDAPVTARTRGKLLEEIGIPTAPRTSDPRPGPAPARSSPSGSGSSPSTVIVPTELRNDGPGWLPNPKVVEAYRRYAHKEMARNNGQWDRNKAARRDAGASLAPTGRENPPTSSVLPDPNVEDEQSAAHVPRETNPNSSSFIRPIPHGQGHTLLPEHAFFLNVGVLRDGATQFYCTVGQNAYDVDLPLPSPPLPKTHQSSTGMGLAVDPQARKTPNADAYQSPASLARRRLKMPGPIPFKRNPLPFAPFPFPLFWECNGDYHRQNHVFHFLGYGSTADDHEKFFAIVETHVQDVTAIVHEIEYDLRQYEDSTLPRGWKDEKQRGLTYWQDWRYACSLHWMRIFYNTAFEQWKDPKHKSIHLPPIDFPLSFQTSLVKHDQRLRLGFSMTTCSLNWRDISTHHPLYLSFIHGKTPPSPSPRLRYVIRRFGLKPLGAPSVVEILSPNHLRGPDPFIYGPNGPPSRRGAPPSSPKKEEAGLLPKLPSETHQTMEQTLSMRESHVAAPLSPARQANMVTEEEPALSMKTIRASVPPVTASVEMYRTPRDEPPLSTRRLRAAAPPVSARFPVYEPWQSTRVLAGLHTNADKVVIYGAFEAPTETVAGEHALPIPPMSDIGEIPREEVEGRKQSVLSELLDSNTQTSTQMPQPADHTPAEQTSGGDLGSATPLDLDKAIQLGASLQGESDMAPLHEALFSILALLRKCKDHQNHVAKHPFTKRLHKFTEWCEHLKEKLHNGRRHKWSDREVLIIKSFFAKLELECKATLWDVSIHSPPFQERVDQVVNTFEQQVVEANKALESGKRSLSHLYEALQEARKHLGDLHLSVEAIKAH